MDKRPPERPAALTHLQQWLTRCLPGSNALLRSAQNLKNTAEREVWDCTLKKGDTFLEAVLTLFKPGPLDSVNTNLPPAQVAQKCALAMTELPPLGIPTPRVLGHVAFGGEAAVLSEKIEPIPWTPRVRIQAAGILARIHSLEERALSAPLRQLVQISDPREYRTTGGQIPKTATRTLVHGDYFSVNILPAADGLRVIDWETFGRGDPMWDLGFLIGADRDLPDDEVRAVIAEYKLKSPVDRERLTWHQRRWAEFWKRRA